MYYLVADQLRGPELEDRYSKKAATTMIQARAVTSYSDPSQG